jgi:hypothetical protein
MRMCFIMYYMSLGGDKLPSMHAIPLNNRIVKEALSSEQNLIPNMRVYFYLSLASVRTHTLHQHSTKT